MPYVSVVMPTMRVGGLDIIFDSLKKQNFFDFEFIIADGLYKYRKDIVAEKSKDCKFTVKHVEPFNNPFPNNAFCRYANSGLAHADSTVIVFITDYTWLEPDCILKHASFHIYNPNRAYMGPHQYYQLKNVSKDFNSYTDNDGINDGAKLYHHSNDDTLKYVEDIENNKYHNLMFSLFNQEFDAEAYQFEKDPILADADPKIKSSGSGVISPTFFHAKNESIPFEHILNINGWNEILDGGHGYQDTDLSDRLYKFTPIKQWYMDISNVAKIINPRPIFPHGYRGRSVAENKEIWLNQCSKDYVAKNKWSLKEVKELNKLKYFYDNSLKKITFD